MSGFSIGESMIGDFKRDYSLLSQVRNLTAVGTVPFYPNPSQFHLDEPTVQVLSIATTSQAFQTVMASRTDEEHAIQLTLPTLGQPYPAKGIAFETRQVTLYVQSSFGRIHPRSLLISCSNVLQ